MTSVAIVRDKSLLRTNDGEMNVYSFFPEEAIDLPAILFFMDGIGIREDLFTMAERMASKNYFVVMPDLYYREGEIAPVDLESAFVEGPEQTRVMQYMMNLSTAGVMSDIEAVFGYLDKRPDVAPPAAAAVGYCMGGQYAFAAAAYFPDRVVSSAIIHGANLVSEEPGSPLAMIDRVRASLYIAIAKIDPWFSADDKTKLKGALDAAGVKYKMEVLPAPHGFAVNGTPAYDRRASEQHWLDLFFLFRKGFGRK